MYLFKYIGVRSYTYIKKNNLNPKSAPLIFASSEDTRDEPLAEIYHHFNRNTGLDEQAVWQMWIGFRYTC